MTPARTTTPWRLMWQLLDRKERTNAFRVLFLAALAAVFSGATVGSMMPFLTALADPRRIHSVKAMAWAYDRFGFKSDYAFLIALGVGAFAMIVLATVLQMLKVYAVAHFAAMRQHAISTRLMTRYLAQPYEYFLSHHSGDMSTRILSEAQEAVSMYLRPAADLITSSLTVACVVAVLIFVQPVVAVASICLLGGTYSFVYALVRSGLLKLGQRRAEANSERYRLTSEAIGGMKELQLVGRELDYVDRFSRPSRQMAQAMVGVELLSQVPYYAIQAVALGAIILLCLVLLDPDQISSGAALGNILPLLGVFAFAGQRLMPDLGKIYTAVSNLRSGGVVVGQLHADLIGGSAPKSPPRHRAERLGLRQDLRLEDVVYRYPGETPSGVESISVTIKAGQRIGIVGGTGAGKTTLANLILGLVQPQGGRLWVDGRPIGAQDLRGWQQTIGYVPQDIFLCDASLTENIALGVPPEQIDTERVIRAAQIAQLDGFIREELPNGYGTAVGERGVRLSGGQRQRVGIARALYHEADLILFDEATSALDTLTEAEVMAAINALPGDKTVVMIAHRLSTLRDCDAILVMEKGRVAGFGPWEVLLASNKAFQLLSGQGTGEG